MKLEKKMGLENEVDRGRLKRDGIKKPKKRWPGTKNMLKVMKENMMEEDKVCIMKENESEETNDDL